MPRKKQIKSKKIWRRTSRGLRKSRNSKKNCKSKGIRECLTTSRIRSKGEKIIINYCLKSKRSKNLSSVNIQHYLLVENCRQLNCQIKKIRKRNYRHLMISCHFLLQMTRIRKMILKRSLMLLKIRIHPRLLMQRIIPKKRKMEKMA